MRTTISLAEPLLLNAKQLASRRGVTLSEVVEDALRADLARQLTDDSPPFHLHTVRGKLVQPDLDLDRTSALLTGDDELIFSSGSFKG